MTEPARPAAPPAASTFQKGNSPAGVASCIFHGGMEARHGGGWWREVQDGSLVGSKVRGGGRSWMEGCSRDQPWVPHQAR